MNLFYNNNNFPSLTEIQYIAPVLHSNAPTLESYSRDDLEYYIIRAIKEYYLLYNNIPDIFLIQELITEQIKKLNKTTFYFNNDAIIFRNQLTFELIEYLLDQMKAEYKNMLGEHMHSAQNLLFEVMLL